MTDWTQCGLFKAFVPGKNAKGKEKEPAVSQYTKNDENHLTWEQCKPYKNVLGILSDDAVLIDGDDETNSDNLLKIIQGQKLACLVTQRNGGRGNHALFKNTNGLVTGNHTSVMLACGVVVDVKTGYRNGLECLKFNGIERISIYNELPYQDIPKYLTPIKGCNINFADMEAGDGRNQALFNYELTLQSNDFSIEEARQTIRLINAYVLKDPLSENELETILRDDAFKKPVFIVKGKFLHDRFGNYLKNNKHVKKINGQLHIFRDGVYVPGYAAIEKAMIEEISNLTDAKRKESLKYLNVTCDECNQSNVNLIAFRNGIYNLNDDTLTPFTPDHIITNKIDWDYNPNAQSDLVDAAFDKWSCNDKQVRSIMEEVIGSCFYRSNKIGGGKSFVMVGDKENGKSTFLETIRNLLGIDNTSSLDLKETNDRFKTAELFGKLANIGDDISDDFITDPSKFKKLVTGEMVNAERKGQDPFDFVSYAKLIFSANTMPRIKDRTGAVLRRLLMIPFEAKITAQDPDFDPMFEYKLKQQSCMEYFIQLGIQGLKRVLQNKVYSSSTRVQKELNDFEKTNNPVLAFLEECENEDVAIENEPTSDIYRKYQEFCVRNEFKPLSNIEFSKQVNKQYGFTTVRKKVQGKNYHVFIRKDDD